MKPGLVHLCLSLHTAAFEAASASAADGKESRKMLAQLMAAVLRSCVQQVEASFVEVVCLHLQRLGGLLRLGAQCVQAEKAFLWRQ